jgi:hypothetical protein
MDRPGNGNPSFNDDWRLRTLRIFGSGCLDDATGFDATGAHYHFFGSAVAQGAHALQVGFEPAFGHVVGMADVAADHWSFSANFTYFSHNKVSTASKFRRKARFAKIKAVIYLLFSSL